MTQVLETLPERVRRRENLLSPSHRKIARFCINEPKEASELTALRIANKLGVSESTVVRFALRMGYEGFPDMQASIRAAAQERTILGSVGEIPARDKRVHDALLTDAASLRAAVEAFDYQLLHECSAALHRARRVHI